MPRTTKPAAPATPGARLSSRYGPEPTVVAARIRGERERLGLTQDQAAMKLGISRSTYKQLERAANPQLSTLLGLVDQLGMRPTAILPELLRAR